MTGRELFVCSKRSWARKSTFLDNGRNRYLDSFLPRPFTEQLQRGEKPPRLRKRRVIFFLSACSVLPIRTIPLIGRVTEHCPHGRPVPCGFSSAGSTPRGIKPSIVCPILNASSVYQRYTSRYYAASSSTYRSKRQRFQTSSHSGTRRGRRKARLLNQFWHGVFCHALCAPRNLSPLIFRDHTLELDEELLLGW